MGTETPSSAVDLGEGPWIRGYRDPKTERLRLRILRICNDQGLSGAFSQNENLQHPKADRLRLAILAICNVRLAILAILAICTGRTFAQFADLLNAPDWPAADGDLTCLARLAIC